MLDPRGDNLVEHANDLVGLRVGRDIPVLRSLAAQQVSDTASYDPAALAALTEALADGEHILRNALDELLEIAHTRGLSRASRRGAESPHLRLSLFNHGS